MKELKKFELNNKILNDFDNLMEYHLDTVEELSIKEAFTNSKLYNIVSLCTNLKTMIIMGDLRVDVNKIISNVCKPELLENLILDSVKLPTTKNFSKFTNLKTISLINITFSNVYSMFDKIPEKEKITAINLSNVDMGKKSISICSLFPNLRYFNIDSLINCKFDDFSFLSSNTKIKRVDFFGNEVDFEQVKDLMKNKYTKNINLQVKTSKDSRVDNKFEINENNGINLIVNSLDLDNAISHLNLNKIDNFFLVIDNKIDLSEYIKKLRKIKTKLMINITDISYLDIDLVQDLRDKLMVEDIGVLDYEKNKVKIYSIDEYIEIREKFDEIVSKFSEYVNDIEMFEELYNYIKLNVRYSEEEIDSDIRIFLMDNESNYNLYAFAMNSILKVLEIECKLISGDSYGENGHVWNQVNINGDWYNVDLGGDLKFKPNKKIKKSKLKEILMDDETFLKTHIARSKNVTVCNTKIIEKKKELKRSNKKMGMFKRIINKIKDIFKLNKTQKLPVPNNEDEKM